MALALLPIPCLVVAPVALVAVAVAVPLWLVALLLTGAAWAVVASADVVARLAGVEALVRPRAALARALHVLTHPTFPARWRR